jgi:hypothetical protein
MNLNIDKVKYGLKSPPDPSFKEIDDPNVKGAKYQKVKNSKLFEPGCLGTVDKNEDIHPNDVKQGYIGDCYFMASLAAIAHNDPEAIKDMIRDNGDGTYTVTFYEKKSLFDFSGPDYKPAEVTVDADFPMKNGSSVFAGEGDNGNEIWVMLMEKAYAQYNKDYSKIEGGWPDKAMQELTGIKSETISADKMDIDTLAELFGQGKALTAATKHDWKLGPIDIPDSTDSNPIFQNRILYTDHAYCISDVDQNAGTVTLQNPWGWTNSGIVLSFQDFQKSFSQIAINSISPPIQYNDGVYDNGPAKYA